MVSGQADADTIHIKRQRDDSPGAKFSVCQSQIGSKAVQYAVTGKLMLQSAMTESLLHSPLVRKGAHCMIFQKNSLCLPDRE